MAFDKQLSAQSILDGLGQGILIFDQADQLVQENLAARTLLGGDLKLIRASGWTAAAALFSSHAAASETADAARKRALDSARPVRFRIYRGGEYIPCWASVIYGTNGEEFTLITIEMPDWSALTDLIARFREEVASAAASTQGHTKVIQQSLKATRPGETVEQLSRRIGGFVTLITTHMHRMERLTALFERLERIRTGTLLETIQKEYRRIDLADFIEDLLEGLDETRLLDPETEAQDYRSRIKTSVPEGVYITASSDRLTDILHDILRNAIMYSMKATPIQIVAQAQTGAGTVQIDVIDEGYGVRAKEFERVFAPFERARQPQIIGEFGYGLSLYLCKHEIEAMNGRIWFQSEEGVGTTFSFKLPLWQDDSASRSSSSSSDT